MNDDVLPRWLHVALFTRHCLTQAVSVRVEDLSAASNNIRMRVRAGVPVCGSACLKARLNISVHTLAGVGRRMTHDHRASDLLTTELANSKTK